MNLQFCAMLFYLTSFTEYSSNKYIFNFYFVPGNVVPLSTKYLTSPSFIKIYQKSE